MFIDKAIKKQEKAFGRFNVFIESFVYIVSSSCFRTSS